MVLTYYFVAFVTLRDYTHCTIRAHSSTPVILPPSTCRVRFFAFPGSLPVPVPPSPGFFLNFLPRQRRALAARAAPPRRARAWARGGTAAAARCARARRRHGADIVRARIADRTPGARLGSHLYPHRSPRAPVSAARAARRNITARRAPRRMRRVSAAQNSALRTCRRCARARRATPLWRLHFAVQNVLPLAGWLLLLFPHMLSDSLRSVACGALRLALLLLFALPPLHTVLLLADYLFFCARALHFPLLFLFGTHHLTFFFDFTTGHFTVWFTTFPLMPSPLL